MALPLFMYLCMLSPINSTCRPIIYPPPPSAKDIAKTLTVATFRSQVWNYVRIERKTRNYFALEGVPYLPHFLQVQHHHHQQQPASSFRHWTLHFWNASNLRVVARSNIKTVLTLFTEGPDPQHSKSRNLSSFNPHVRTHFAASGMNTRLTASQTG